MDDIEVDHVSEFAKGLSEFVEQNQPELLKQIDKDSEFSAKGRPASGWNEDWKKKMEKTVKDYKRITNKDWIIQKEQSKEEKK